MPNTTTNNSLSKYVTQNDQSVNPLPPSKLWDIALSTSLRIDAAEASSLRYMTAKHVVSVIAICYCYIRAYVCRENCAPRSVFNRRSRCVDANSELSSIATATGSVIHSSFHVQQPPPDGKDAVAPSPRYPPSPMTSLRPRRVAPVGVVAR